MKRTAIICIVVCLLVMLAAVVMFFAFPRTNLYDNDKKLAADFNTYNLVNARYNIEEQRIYGTFDTFEGMINLWEYEVSEEQELTVDYTLHVTEGKVKLVLITPDDTVTTLVERTAESESEEAEGTCTITVKAGNNRIKIVGDKGSSVEFDLSIAEGDFTSH